MLDKPRTDGPIPRAPNGGIGGKLMGGAKNPQSLALPAFGLGKRAEGVGARRAMRPINLERRARFARFDA